MAIISNKPFVESISKDELRERLDVHFYKPNLRMNSKHLESLPGLLKLEEIVLDEYPITSGSTPKGANYLDNGIPFLRVQNVRPMSINLDDIVFISEETHKGLKRSTILQNDVLLTITGATFGYSAIYNDEEYSEANVNQHIVRIRVDEEKAIPLFIALFLNSNFGYLQSLRHSTGGSRPALDFGSINRFLIPCPPKSEQEIILARFKKIKYLEEEIIQRSYIVTKKRDEYFNSIVNTIATQIGLTEFPRPWFNRFYFKKYTSLNDRLDVLGANPQFEDECWASGKFVPLSAVCEVDGSNEQIPLGLQRYVSIDSLPGNFWGDIDLPEKDITEQTIGTKFNIGDIAWSRLKPSILQSKVYIINKEGWGSPEFLKIITSKVSDDLRTIIWAYLKTSPIKRHLANKCTGKSESQKRVTEEMLGMLPFPKLNEKQIKKIASAIRETIEKSHELEAQENAYREKADNLLKKAKSNIFNLLDDTWFNNLVAEATEALK